MSALAIGFPPVGVFGIALAVLGAILSVVGFKGWKRIAFPAFFILLGIGEFTSIWKADLAHQDELARQHNDVENLRVDLRTSDTQRQVAEAYLKAKLEDAYQMNAQLAKFAPAIMKLAETSAEFTRKQYEVKVTSDKELYAFTMAEVKKIREFSQKYQTLSRQQTDEQFNSMRRPNLTEAERQQRWNEQTQKSTQLYYSRDNEFRTSILPDALYARQELLKRKISEPTLSPMQKSEVDIVMRGALAGPYPELALANYLEVMAKQLRLE
jgi:hypothetical protein